MPGIFKIIFLVQVGVGTASPVLCTRALRGRWCRSSKRLKRGDIFIARFSAQMVAHHQSSMVGRACASGEITRAGPAQRQTSYCRRRRQPQGSGRIVLQRLTRRRATYAAAVIAIIGNAYARRLSKLAARLSSSSSSAFALGHGEPPISSTIVVAEASFIAPRPVLTAAIGINSCGKFVPILLVAIRPPRRGNTPTSRRRARPGRARRRGRPCSGRRRCRCDGAA